MRAYAEELKIMASYIFCSFPGEKYCDRCPARDEDGECVSPSLDQAAAAAVIINHFLEETGHADN